ncbi:MAG: hypothetical protein AAGE52_38805 [Myxococcota bacterium]
MADHATSSTVDLRLRILAVSLEPSLALARIMALPLDDLQQLVTDGYFRELRLRGQSLRQISRRMGKSLRTVATLSKRSQEKGPLLDESRRLGWQRAVIRATSQQACTVDELRALGGVEDHRVEEELEQMVASGLLEVEDERYRVAVVHVSFAREETDARLESLRHFLTTVAHVVYRRFFRPEPNAEAFARVLSFSAEPQTLSALRARYYEALRDSVIETDSEASDEAPQGSVVFAAVTTPTDLAWSGR